MLSSEAVPVPLASASPPDAPAVAVPRLYSVWPSRSMVCLRGKVLAGPKGDVPILVLGVLLMVGLGALWLATVGRWMAQHVHVAVPVVGALLVLLDTVLYISCAFCDPGILPRLAMRTYLQRVEDRTAPGAFDAEYVDFTHWPHGAWPIISRAESPNARAMRVPASRQCYTCRITRPRGATHCSACDNCVIGYDHHCVWLANCVGQRNHRAFAWLLLATTAYAAYVFGTSLHVVLHEGLVLRFVGPCAALLCAFGAFVMLAAGLTAVVMLEVVSTGQTTKLRDRVGRPLDMTCGRRCANLWAFFAHYPPRPSLLLSRGRLTQPLDPLLVAGATPAPPDRSPVSPVTPRQQQQPQPPGSAGAVIASADDMALMFGGPASRAAADSKSSPVAAAAPTLAVAPVHAPLPRATTAPRVVAVGRSRRATDNPDDAALDTADTPDTDADAVERLTQTSTHVQPAQLSVSAPPTSLPPFTGAVPAAR